MKSPNPPSYISPEEEVRMMRVAERMARSGDYLNVEAIEAAASYVSLAITRKRSEEALRASEARLHAIIHNTPNVAVELYDLGPGHIFVELASPAGEWWPTAGPAST